MPTMPPNTAVSVLLVIRNEKKHIAKCLDSLTRQTYPEDRYEILVIDGYSKDGTRQITRRYANSHKNIRLFVNPKKVKPAGLNIGLKQAHGKIIIIFDGHAEASADFIAQNVKYLEKTNAACVGGPVRTRGTNYLSRAIAMALSCNFGAGGAKFRTCLNYEGYVKTVAFGAYRKKIFTKVGFFNEKRQRTEDVDMHYRIKKAGGRFFITPRIKSIYYCRHSWPGMIKQAWGNGQEVMTILRGLSLRHLIPLIFVLSLLLTSILSSILAPAKLLLLLITVSYLVASSFFSLKLSIKRGWKYLPALLITFALLHLSYGFGSLSAVIRRKKYD